MDDVSGTTPADAHRAQQQPTQFAAAGTSSSCATCCLSATDACSLLETNTEEVLAILHAAAAFAATAGAISDEGALVPPPHSETQGSAGSTTAECSGEDSPLRQLQSATRSDAKKKKSTESPKDRLAQLREAVRKHEDELTALHQENRLATRHEQIWQELASHQLRWRQRAETENQQLKAVLHHVLQTVDPQQLDQQIGEALFMMDQLPNYLHGRQKKVQPSSVRDEAALASVFESLLRRLDIGFAEIDAVFRENGLDQAITETRAYAERKSRRLGEACSFIEIVKLHLVPFDWRRFGDTVWRCTLEWHLKDDVYMYPSANRPEDTFAINYRVMSQSSDSRSLESANVTLAVRRYWQADRFVIVYASQLNGENELAGASVRDISCVVASNVSSLSKPGSPPVSVIQSCLHLFPTAGGANELDGQEKAQSLLNLMIDAIQEDISQTQRRVDSSLLLQRPRAPNASRAGEDDKETTRIRFAFRDPTR